jgi:hypothetical protein
MFLGQKTASDLEVKCYVFQGGPVKSPESTRTGKDVEMTAADVNKGQLESQMGEST